MAKDRVAPLAAEQKGIGRDLLVASKALALCCALAACTPGQAPSEASKGPPQVEQEVAPPAESGAVRESATEAKLAPEIVLAPRQLGASVAEFVQRAAKEASAEKRRLVVYVGATWCEPCRRFHDALKRGELNAALAGVRFLEFDHDVHQEGLRAAGYLSRFVPLFALPGPDGRATENLHQGAIKGPGAVDFIVPRLTEMLRRGGAEAP